MNPRLSGFAALLLAGAGAAGAQGRGDAIFRRLPFETWRTQGTVTQIRWKLGLSGAQLSPQQRLLERLQVEIDQSEVERRRGHGDLVFLFELEDAAGKRYRSRQLADLTRIPDDTKAPGLSWMQDIYILPGTYRLAAAVVDMKTQEHSFLTRDVRVTPKRSEPLPEAWRDLPPVEFVRLYGQPDSWFEPGLRSHLNLPVASKRPVKIDIVLNMTLSERSQGSLRAFRRNMSLLVPSLRVLTDLKPETGSLNVTVLDLALKKKWDQDDVRTLDWSRLREPFAATTPGMIDAQSLAGKAAMQQFFWDAVVGRIETVAGSKDPPLHIVIVLSGPVFLEQQYRVEPSVVAKDPNRRVYYLQYRPIPPRPLHLPDGEMAPPAMPIPSDDLEHTLKLLDAKVFPLISPEQFRKALATIISDIARM